MQVAYLIFIVIIICLLHTCAALGFLAEKDLNVISASVLCSTAWIDLLGSIGFIDLKNNSARVLMRLIMCSFITQV